MVTRIPDRPLRAILFDLDGTLYEQPPLRWRMLRELAWTPLTHGPRAAHRLASILKSFRRQREGLREIEAADTPLVHLQYQVVADELGVDVNEVLRVVEDWMFSRPLRHLRAHRRAGLGAFLREARQRALGLGVFSDYPVERKLEALGLQETFDCQVDATDPSVDAFKPDPRGFLVCAERLNVEPEEVLYVGDRADVDAEGARRAGMRSVVLNATPCDDGNQYAAGFREVWRVVEACL